MGEKEKCSVSLLLNNNVAIYSWKQLKQPVPQFCTELPHAADIRLDLRPLVITIYELVPAQLGRVPVAQSMFVTHSIFQKSTKNLHIRQIK